MLKMFTCLNTRIMNKGRKRQEERNMVIGKRQKIKQRRCGEKITLAGSVTAILSN